MSKKLVFVSYSHKDRALLDKEVVPFLAQLKLGEQIELWDDRLIGVGEDWYAQIADQLDKASVAILLVTQNFLASRFCLHEEVPVLLQRARRGELHLLPLLAQSCNWKNERWLARSQMWPRDAKALNLHSKAKRQAVLAEFAELVLKGVQTPAALRTEGVSLDAPSPTHDLHRMPQTGSLLFGRRDEIKLLDDAWIGGETNIVAFTAGGGVGKSTLARVWTEMLAEDGWRGAERAYAWSFYSQGTGRMTDSETFLNEALKWFVATEWEGRSIWDRAEMLAEKMRQHRTLLILDGVEPLQSGEDGVDRGSLRDPGLRTLLEELAKGHPGLCVVTTRERLVDLADAQEPAVLHKDLDQVAPLAGRALLRVARVRGDDKELEAAVEDVGGHALAVSLLGNLLKDSDVAPHVSGAKTLPKLAHPVEQGGHPRRVLDAWAQRLGDGAELELLHIVGLFDRPANRSAMQAVIDGDPLPGLNRKLRAAKLDAVLERLRGVKLLAKQSTHEDTLDTHPIVREHFGARLKALHPKSWQEGHRRLYQHFKDNTEHQPDDLPGMQPLFAAVVHGCAAGLHQQACDEIYFERIKRGGKHYLWRQLGAFAADLSCLSHFFAEPWQVPQSALSSADQSWVIGVAGFLLRGLGRLREAVGPSEEALRLGIEAKDWGNASRRACNLSELHLALGELALAEARARDAVAHADASGDGFLQWAQRTSHADALHQLGRVAEARALFAEAERMQVEQQPDYPLLYSAPGYQYCDLLVAAGEAREVLRRATQLLEWASARRTPLEIALNHLSLGRVHLAATPPDLNAAESHLWAAVDGFRASGLTDFVPRGFLARAAFHRMRDELPSAWKDLDTVQTLVRRHGLRLFEADLALEQTRCHLAANNRESARTTLEHARKLITEMSYGRRVPELNALDAELKAAP
jgi:tetratricopeptide (TPR) repeat protein